MVSVESLGKSNELFYRAAPGERNAVVASTDGAVVTFADPRAEVTAGNGCVAIGDHAATCNFPGLAAVNMELRNRNDRGRVSGAMIRLTADGGAGRDRLTGGGLFDRLDGGRGPDALNGRGGPDMVLYSGRADDVRVTLGDGKRNDGGPRDGPLRDRLRNMEALVGGAGDDRLSGSPAENTLSGGPGRDVLRGRGGDDEFFAGDGRDRSLGGPGADLFYSDPGSGRQFGGPGQDHFQGGAPDEGVDLFTGGPGLDTFQGYSFGAWRVSLDGRANDGPCGNAVCSFTPGKDNVKGIEELQGSFGDDFLIGSGRDEIFRPSLGADRVRAKGGDDLVHLNPDGEVDVINCGAGIDDVLGTPDAFDQNVDCE